MQMANPTNFDLPGQYKYVPANLVTLDYEKLHMGDTTEINALLKAGSESACFYLDLFSSNMEQYQTTVSTLFDASNQFFRRPLEEKMKDFPPELDILSFCGYKPLGELGLDAGNVENKKNGCEHLRIPADTVFNPEADLRLHCAKGIKQHFGLLQHFIYHSHSIAETILSRVSDALGLEALARLEAFHQSSAPSTSIASLQYYPAADLPQDTSMGHFAHTDASSLTILFNDDEGLQAFSSERNAWENVPPRQGCAIINVGDTLRFISRLKLASSLHRVIPWQPRPLTAAAPLPRESRSATIFFLQPNINAMFEAEDGVTWTAAERVKRKFQNYRASHAEQGLNAISTGKKGFTGVLDVSEEAGIVATDRQERPRGSAMV